MNGIDAERPLDTWPRPRALIAIALLLLYGASLVRDIDGPWVGMHDWNGAFYSYLARNLLRYPVEVTRLLPVAEMGPGPPTAADAVRYANHPPGIEWLLAGAFGALGVNESAARVVPILASLASLWLLMRIAASTLGRGAAAIAGLLYAVMPMATYFGRMVDQEPVCLFFMLLAVWGWYASLGIVATRASRKLCLAAWMIGLAGGILVDWIGVLVAAAMCVEVVVRMARRQCRPGVLWAAILVPGVTCGGVLGLLVYGGMDGSWAAMWDMFFSRAAGAVAASQPMRDMATRGGPWEMVKDNLSWGILVLAAAGALAMIGSAARGGGRPRDRAALVFLTCVGGAWLVLFRGQFERHNYWMFYLGPSAAMLAGTGLVWLHARLAAWWLRTADAIAALVLVAAVGLGLRGTNDYFARRSFSVDSVQVWRFVREHVQPTQEVLLLSDPRQTERQGAYSYRNIVPPHLAYYLDRRPTVVHDAAEIAAHAGHGAVLLIPATQIPAAEGILRTLSRKFPRYVNHPYLIVDLDPGLGRRLGERVR